MWLLDQHQKKQKKQKVVWGKCKLKLYVKKTFDIRVAYCKKQEILNRDSSGILPKKDLLLRVSELGPSLVSCTWRGTILQKALKKLLQHIFPICSPVWLFKCSLSAVSRGTSSATFGGAVIVSGMFLEAMFLVT